MEPTTAIGAGLAVLGSKELLTKLLGPTADYIGNEARGLVEKCNLNLDRIFRRATAKLGDRINEDGLVNPRVLKHILDDGRFCDDELTAEYYAGVLASARVPVGRDDRGVTFLAVIKELSVYQLRFHYAYYCMINRLYKDQAYNLGTADDRDKLRLFIPHSAYHTWMDFSESEDSNQILGHTLYGLSKHALIESDFISGGAEYMQTNNRNIDISEGGMLVTPSLSGAELFLWSLGVIGASGTEILKVESPGEIEGLNLVDEAVSVTNLRKDQNDV